MSADVVKGKSVQRSPIESSANRGSATVTEISNGAEISYNTPYSVWLHESQNYSPKEPGTGPGYLRNPLLEESYNFFSDVARAVKAIK
jgi:hypothetical protein